MELIGTCLKTYTIEILSSRKNIKQVDKILKKVKKEFELDEYRFNNLSTAITELVLNAIVHGNKENEKKKVKVVIEFDDEHLKAFVEDEGNGVNPDEACHPTLPEDLLNISGRGLYIVKSLVNDVNYYQTKKGFCCVLTVNK